MFPPQGARCESILERRVFHIPEFRINAIHGNRSDNTGVERAVAEACTQISDAGSTRHHGAAVGRSGHVAGSVFEPL